jgi:hypothetical protein
MRGSWAIAAVKTKEDPIGELVELASRVERKVSQVRRRAEGAKGIILVKSWLARSGALGQPESVPILENIRSRVLASHSDLAGVLVVQRAHDEDDRPYFGGVWVEGRDGAPLQDILDRLRVRESEMSVLDDWD